MGHPDILLDHGDFRRLAGDVLPDDPFTALRYHFGMLLGVEDFETEQAFHRGKGRLHQAWLHGPGVVWGLAVAVDVGDREIRVEPGLAVDGAGRDLHLDGPACLDPGAWFAEHEDEVEPAAVPPAGADVAFDAWVELRHAACLSRPVPALAEPCEDSAVDTAYSRLWETVDLRLRPGPAPELPPPGASAHQRVRILLGQLAPGDGAGDDEAAAARAGVLAAAPADRPAAALDAFRAMANLDAIDLRPAEDADSVRALTPVAPPAPLVLAELRGLALRKDEDERWVVVGGAVDLARRRSHVAAITVQELHAVALAGAAAPAAGPQITGVELDGTTLTLALGAPLDVRTVQQPAFTVTGLGDDGWTDLTITAVTATAAEVVLELDGEPATPWRVVARGTGSAPLLGEDGAELGGGRDFVHTERS